ncbi:MAG: hypothetical protein G01um101438_500 [Parcubacteria group bacterium Gr01-1014_38]|nr:MAG: hypothetical protein G01um101438_500 [Parcubacteria group bacterium Gr01-1014_38]
MSVYVIREPLDIPTEDSRGSFRFHFDSSVWISQEPDIPTAIRELLRTNAEKVYISDASEAFLLALLTFDGNGKIRRALGELTRIAYDETLIFLPEPKDFLITVRNVLGSRRKMGKSATVIAAILTLYKADAETALAELVREIARAVPHHV